VGPIFIENGLQLVFFMAENNQNEKPWSALGFAWELGYSIVIPIVIFALAGRLLDKKLDTAPWLLLLGIIISIIVTTVLVYQKTIKVMKQ
jgi:F0F1-type ATP synthase assembly protein I